MLFRSNGDGELIAGWGLKSKINVNYINQLESSDDIKIGKPYSVIDDERFPLGINMTEIFQNEMFLNKSVTIADFLNVKNKEIALFYRLPLATLNQVFINNAPIVHDFSKNSTLDMTIPETILSESVYSFYFWNYLRWQCRESKIGRAHV